MAETPAPIGFAILSHREPLQLLRLVERLRALYGPGAPIAIHHDFGQSQLDTGMFPPEVRWVRPHLSTGWGVWGTVEAVLASLRLLYPPEGPEFAVLLSGADYPIAPAARVIADLRAGGADAYIDARPVLPWRRDPVVDKPLGLGVNDGGPNQEVCFRRYYSSIFRVLGVRVRIRSRLLAPLLSPFSRHFRCWAGEHWWTLGRRAVAHLLRSPVERPDLVRWFAERHIPEEAYVHTVVCNAPGLRVTHRSLRYVDWTSRRPSPRELGVEDVPKVLESGAHFARKFRAGDPALDLLDTALELPPWHEGPSTP